MPGSLSTARQGTENRDTAMTNSLIKDIEQSQLKTDLPEISVGDTIDVHVRIIEGAKERIQIFEGVVIKIQGTGLTRTMTVRRIVANEGVERTFPLHSPRIAKIEIRRHGDTRRSRLYYLRDRVGKKRRLRDRRRGLASALPAAPEAAPEKQAEPAAEAASESAES
jgi:large subunit ribosomal protein L19